jgi:hypothetical protein
MKIQPQAIIRHAVSITVIIAFSAWYYLRLQKAVISSAERDDRLGTPKGDHNLTFFTLARGIIRSQINHSRYDYVTSRPDLLTLPRGHTSELSERSSYKLDSVMVLLRKNELCNTSSSESRHAPQLVLELLDVTNAVRLYPELSNILEDSMQRHWQGLSSVTSVATRSSAKLTKKRPRGGILGSLAHFFESTPAQSVKSAVPALMGRPIKNGASFLHGGNYWHELYENKTQTNCPEELPLSSTSIAWCAPASHEPHGHTILLLHSVPGITSRCQNLHKLKASTRADSKSALECGVLRTPAAETRAPETWPECLRSAPLLAEIPDLNVRRLVAKLAHLHLATIVLLV